MTSNFPDLKMKNTMKMQHTFKTWHIGVRQPSSDKFIYGSKGEEIADCDRKTNFPDENLANARLIAAAPCLLAALNGAVAWLENVHEKGDFVPKVKNAINQAHEAIQKATGESI